MKLIFALVLSSLLCQNAIFATQPVVNRNAANFAGARTLKTQEINCTSTDSSDAPSAVQCNGASVTSIIFNNASRTTLSGTNNTVGVKYRYANAGTAPDGTVVDAIVTVVSYSNNHDSSPTTFRDADLAPGTGNIGFDQNLQPSLEQESNVFTSNNSWNGSITYKIQFVVGGTTTPKTISVAATTIDNDGSNACGGLRETVSFSSALNQTLTSNTTNQTKNGNSFTGPQVVQSGIGTGIDYANAALYVNVTEFDWTYSFSTTGACANGGASEDRFGSLNLSCQINFNKNFASVAVSGNVYNDANGLTDSIVNGTGTGNPGGTQLYANLLDANNNVVSSVAVAANGTYSFPAALAGSFNIQITTIQGVESNAAPATVLPSGWVSVGEHLGANAGSDGTVDGLLPVTVGTTTITNANFGIEQRPVANNNTAANQTNPGGTNNAVVPASIFTATDTAPGSVSKIRITSFPSNATSITINGTQYTVNNFPQGGVEVPTNANGNPTQTILVDPVDGAVTVGITYVAIDNAGVASLNPATASVPFQTIVLSGTVFNDTNGLTDSTVNGTGTNLSNTLYANLLNSSGSIIQTVAVAPNGSYSFSGLNSGNYQVQISTNPGTIGNAPAAPAFPTGWVSTGENLGANAGSDGTINSNLSVTVGTTPTNITDANFGIEQRPVANNNSTASQNNPGGTVNATVPATVFTAADTAPGSVSGIRITSFPANATSITINGVRYTSNNFPQNGVSVPANTNGNPTQTILVDPVDGAVTVRILYVAVDNAGIESAAPATASVPFSLSPTAAHAQISGKLFFGDIPLRNTLVTIVGSRPDSKKVVRTDAEGRYTFEEATGETYFIEPLSSKYSFVPGNRVVNLNGDAPEQNFSSQAKQYRPKNDFDGDGASDLAVFRASEGIWYVWQSSGNQMVSFKFGAESDVPAAADYDGDGKTDYAVFRPAEGVWYIWQSAAQNMRAVRFGLSDDRLVPADYDGDGKADIAVFRSGAWYISRSSDNSIETRSFGQAADKPAVEDFDGDGKTDTAVYRASEGIWYVMNSASGNLSANRFGLAADVPVAGDYDGDGRADIAQFRRGAWYVQNSSTSFQAEQFGGSEDQAVVGDYDGDGRVDFAVFREGVWTIRSAANGDVRNFKFGTASDQLVK